MRGHVYVCEGAGEGSCLCYETTVNGGLRLGDWTREACL